MRSASLVGAATVLLAAAYNPGATFGQVCNSTLLPAQANPIDTTGITAEFRKGGGLALLALTGVATAPVMRIWNARDQQVPTRVCCSFSSSGLVANRIHSGR